MITHSFEACGITSSRPTDVRPPNLLDGQVCSSSEDEHENPFIDEKDEVMLELKDLLKQQLTTVAIQLKFSSLCCSSPFCTLVFLVTVAVGLCP